VGSCRALPGLCSSNACEHLGGPGVAWNELPISALAKILIAASVVKGFMLESG